MIKPVIYIVFLCLSANNIIAQNYVYNGDFEIYDNCPTSVSTPFDLQINHCLGWTTPTYATSDYFNSCSSGFGVDVPNNSLGYQNSYNGNGYCGFFGCGFDTLSNYQWWEYIQGNVNPLENGKLYKLSIKLNLAEDSYYWVDKIGVYLSNLAYIDYTTTFPLTTLQPQFETPSGVHINDTANWMHFEWVFIADGTENYITIGNFNDFYNSNPVLSPQGGTKGNSYIFIDAVSIEEIESIEISNVFTPNEDGLNDVWKLPFVATNEAGVYIINRWGNIVKQGSILDFSWDGKDENGNDCTEGVYFYVVTINDKKITGNIQLMR